MVSSIVRVFHPRVLCSEEPKMRAYRYESRIWLSIVNKQNFTQSTRVSEMICAVFDTAIVAWASYAP
nr:MAG TPA: hypothetical protein [Caudoviricetes sp.]